VKKTGGRKRKIDAATIVPYLFFWMEILKLSVQVAVQQRDCCLATGRLIPYTLQRLGLTPLSPSLER
jgi:hypothetical protein